MNLLPVVLSILMIVSQSPVFGQNIERESVPIDYILLPQQNLPDSTETYYVSVTNKNTMWGNNLGTTADADKIKLNGYHRLNSTFDADIIANIKVLNDLQFVQVQLETTTLKHRIDKNTEVPYTAYTYTVSYITPQTYYSIKTGSGVTISEGILGGLNEKSFFGSTDYNNSYKNESAISRAWSENKKYKLAEWELGSYQNAVNSIVDTCENYCLNPARISFSVKYVKEKKTNDYDDLRRAKNYFTDAAAYFKTDNILLVNKVVQPDYHHRNELLDSAIAIWEKALEESDLQNKKARIDQKVTRHIYYNLAFAYVLKNDFAKAQQYLQGREDEETNNVALKNTFAGMKNLSSFIDRQMQRSQTNAWRTLLLTEPKVYVYKDPEMRKKEKAEADRQALVKQKATADSLKTAKKTPVKKPATTAKKSTTAVTKKQ